MGTRRRSPTIILVERGVIRLLEYQEEPPRRVGLDVGDDLESVSKRTRPKGVSPTDRQIHRELLLHGVGYLLTSLSAYHERIDAAIKL